MTGRVAQVASATSHNHAQARRGRSLRGAVPSWSASTRRIRPTEAAREMPC